MPSTINTQAIIILGMHRSGTSCLAGTLQQAGVYLGDVSTHNKFNPKGNRENTQIMNLNERLLNFNNSSWDNPPKNKLKFSNTHLKNAKEIIHSLSTNKYWGFKDPRYLLTQSFWKTLLPNARFIGTIRNPLDVALSLNRRDGNFSLNQGLELWLTYNQILLSLLRQQPFPLVSFDSSSSHYQKQLNETIKLLLGTPSPVTSNFFEDKLRTTTKTNHPIRSEIINCYSELKSYLI